MNVLFLLGGGIGNIVQATPAVKATAHEGHTIDLLLYCNSSKDVKDVFQIPAVRYVFADTLPTHEYDVQLRGPFTPNIECKAKEFKNTRIHYAQHRPEVDVYYDLAKQIGIKTPMGDCQVNIGTAGKTPHPDTVAIFPGSKPDWAMKRWDKYDQLATHFKHVLVVGSQQDIESHGSPGWIKNPWNWPPHVEFLTTSLQKAAFIISKCKMFIGNDGGLAHVAAATGIPTYVLFGPSSDVKNKPWAENAHVIAIDLPCRPCQFKKGPDRKQIFRPHQTDCPYHMKCMKEMSVDFVLGCLSKK